jgi:negative regulator of replication initiation
MWFCPNTYHQATTLQALYHKLGAPPEGQEIVQNYSTFVRRLIKMSWQQTVNQTTAMEQAAQTAEGAARELREMTERVKRVILDVPE